MSSWREVSNLELGLVYDPVDVAKEYAEAVEHRIDGCRVYRDATPESENILPRGAQSYLAWKVGYGLAIAYLATAGITGWE